MDANGLLVTTDGYPMSPNITVPTDATQVVVGTAMAVCLCVNRAAIR